MENLCSYTKKDGTNINSAKWLEKFQSLKVSPETGYDWNHISKNIRRQVTETTDTVRAPARTVVQVKQLVGYCGQNTVRTDVFKTELKFSPSLESCVPSESTDLVVKCDASKEKVSFIPKCIIFFHLINNSKN